MIDSNADPLTLAQMHQKLGHAYTQRGNLDDAWQEYRRALQLVITEPGGESDLLIYLYNHLSELGSRWIELFSSNPDMQEVRTYIDAGLKLLEGRPVSGQHAAFLTYQAFWYVFQQLQSADTQQRAEFAELALQSGQEAQRIAEELNDPRALWLTLDALGYIYHRLHKYHEAHKAQHYRLTLADQIKSREELYDLYYSLGWVHEAVCDYSSAAKWFGEAWNIAQTMESPTLLLNCMIGRMYVWNRWNRWNEAQEAAQSILQMVEQYQHNEQWQLDALQSLAVIAYHRGQQEEADHYTRQYKRVLDQYCSQTESTAHMAYIHLAREDWARATAEYQEKLQQSEPFPSPDTLASLAELVVITGESVETQEANCERAVTVAEQSGGRGSLAIALRARGRMYLEQHKWESAGENLKQSLLKCEELDLPWERGKTLYCLGLLYRRRADVLYENEPDQRNADLGRAHFHFEQALGFFESLNAVSDAERARLALAQDSKAPV